ncbi:hypothetical protein ACFL35_12455, partial [Candidatus Riflebacteria bacterium]
MALLQWDELYSVAVEDLDEQHKFLFKLINDFHDSIEKKPDRELELDTLNILVDYAVNHFASEE